MTNRRLTENFELATEGKALESWPDVDSNSLNNKSRIIFQKRKNAVRNYVADTKSAIQIRKEFGIEQSELYRLIKRCYQTAPDGEIFGFRALIPYFRIAPYERKAEGNSGYAGKLQQLFRKYPELEQFVITKYLGKRRKNHIPEPQIKYKNLHKYFLKKSAQLGVGPDEYPFSQVTKGKSALRKFLKGLIDTNIRLVVHARDGENSAKNIDDELIEGILHPTRPYACVEMDAHRIDLRMVVWIPAPDGTEVPVLMERIWLLVIQDEASRSILGYHLSFLRNYGNEDVLQCVMNSIVPWSPKELTIPGLEYGEGEGLPSGLIPNSKWRLFDRLRLDNAMSHVSQMVQKRISRVIKCTVNTGEAGKPKRRPLVERLFQTLEENGFHRISSTTGSNISDTRKRNPEKWAKKYQISLDHLEEILDVVIAQYCDTPHTGLYGRTPLGYLRHDADNPLTLKRFLPESQRDLSDLFQLNVAATIRGNAKQGRRPYIQYENVVYRNPTISSSPTLVGTKLTLKVNILDLRNIKAFLPNGSSIGLLRAEGGWGVRKHSLKIRKTIFKLVRDGKMHLSKDPVLTYTQLLLKNAQTSAKNANQYVTTARAQEGADMALDSLSTNDVDELTELEWRPRRKGWIRVTKTITG